MQKDNEYILILTTDLGLLIGTLEKIDEYNRFVIKEPLRMTPRQGGSVDFSGVLTNEKWIKIPVSQTVEFPIGDGMAKGYEEARMQLFSGLVTASQKEKRLILN